MILAERLYLLYYRVPDFSKLGKAGRVIDKLLAFVLKRILDRQIPSYYEMTLHINKLNVEKRSKRIICAMTSFPGRIENVWIALESLFRQSVPPDRIFLVLSKDQFKDRALPKSIERLIEKGLEVVYVEDDLKAHKKYLYAIDDFPDDYVITFDDDLYYDRLAIENLLDLKKRYPDAIVTNRAHKIRFTKGSIRPYRKWEHNSTFSKPSHRMVATGGCGTLYQKYLLNSDFSNTDLIKSLSPHADDLWLKVMAYLNGTKIVTNGWYGKDPIVIGSTQTEKLVTTNVLTGGNDLQLSNLIGHYKISPIQMLD